MRGFFAPSAFAGKRPLPLVAKCGKCGLHLKCHSPKMPVDGNGRKGILIVAEVPGFHEDQQGIPLVGKSGKHLHATLARFGLDMREDCWLTNSNICRTADADGRNRNPTSLEVGYCRPNLIRTVTELQPTVIILAGAKAVESLIGWLWKDEGGIVIGRWIGWQIPCQRLNCWIVPVWHPSFLLREADRKQKYNVAQLLWEKHLRAAVELEDRPWHIPPDYASRVRVELDARRAARLVREMVGSGRMLAWDLETTTLKPDSDSAEIVSCSVSDGRISVAYPWHGEAMAATLEMIKSDVPKVASNLKFESRFASAKMQVEVRNWCWDTMLAAHVLDNRSHISSIKFQAWIRLGQDSWDDHIKPYLKGESGGKNRIRELDLQDLLRYNAMDSLMEHLVAQDQMREMGVPIP